MKNASSDPRLFYPGGLLVLHVWMAGAQLGSNPGIPGGGRVSTDRCCAIPIEVEPGCRGIPLTASCERPYLQFKFSRYLSVSTWRGRRLFEAKTCAYVMFRDAQDNYPFVTFCAPGHFELVHAHTANGQLLHRFEFVCEKAKFQIHLSPASAFLASYIELN